MTGSRARPIGRTSIPTFLVASAIVLLVSCSGGSEPASPSTTTSGHAGSTAAVAPTPGPSTSEPRGPISVPPSSCRTPEQLQVAEVAGRAELVDERGQVVHLHGVNVRFERNGDGLPLPYSPAQFRSIRSFGTTLLRVAVRWRDLQPQPGAIDGDFAERLDRFVRRAADAGLQVLLDPIHVGGGDADDHFVPRWANGGRPVTTDDVVPALERYGLRYLSEVLARYCDQRNVIGLDLVNEPREDRRRGADLNARNERLMVLYRRWIAGLRTVDPDKLLFLEPYYGITMIEPNLLSWLASDGGEGGHGNLVWAPHDYHTGGSGDGYSSDGYPLLDANDAGSYRSRGSYPSDPEQRRRRRLDDVAHLRPQAAAAAAGGMPLLVGEFGIPYGWSGRRDLLCDKARVYREQGWSWTVWALDDRVDEAYGLWDPETMTWNPIADPLAGGATAC